MHRPRSQHAAVALKRGGILYVLTTLALLVSIGILAYSICINSRELVIKAILAALGSGLALAIAHLITSNARCPLCTNRVLHSSRCQRHRKARPFFGSFRLRVARDIVLLNRFRCPYCGEPTECVPRERQR